MAYREDEDLIFLKDCPNEELDVIFTLLTKGQDGNPRLTEEITANDRHKANQPDHSTYWDLIAGELQCFGGNSFATMLRGGKGVLYKELLVDACDKMKVNYNKNSSIEIIESNLLMKILTDSIADMSPEQVRELVNELEINTTDFSKQAVIAALQLGARLSGFMAYKIAVIVANAIAKMLLGRGLTFAAGATLTKSMSVIIGPVGWAITAAWTVMDIAGPAYRVTIPCVIQIACLRAKRKYALAGVKAAL
jgi:uncharacterized protein YaaW (UPF0174 family)